MLTRSAAQFTAASVEHRTVPQNAPMLTRSAAQFGPGVPEREWSGDDAVGAQ